MSAARRDLPTLYLETTVVSYQAARPSSNVLILAHQEVTRHWWKRCRERYRIFVSPLVLQESAKGDPAVARERLLLLRDFEVLDSAGQIESMAHEIKDILFLPKRAASDAAHLAFAVYYEMDFLVTWNCAHLANAHNLRLLADHVRARSLWLPVICTPEEMTEEATGD